VEAKAYVQKELDSAKTSNVLGRHPSTKPPERNSTCPSNWLQPVWPQAKNPICQTWTPAYCLFWQICGILLHRKIIESYFLLSVCILHFLCWKINPVNIGSDTSEAISPNSGFGQYRLTSKTWGLQKIINSKTSLLKWL
jgi:hypothetical protein